MSKRGPTSNVILPRLDVQQEAEILNVHVGGVRKFIYEKKLASVRIGDRVLVDREDVHRFVDERRSK